MLQVQDDWRLAFADLQNRLARYLENPGWTLCGLSVCVDAFMRLDQCDALFDASAPPEAALLAAELKRRAASGIGGEIRVEWPKGPAWIDAYLPTRLALGGTAAHAARLLTLLGAPALLALDHRSTEQLSVIDPDILIAQTGRPMRSAEIDRQDRNRDKVYIFEFTRGVAVAGVKPPRSSRIIVRFHDILLEHDQGFVEIGTNLVGGDGPRGAGILAGFNGLRAGADLNAGLAAACMLASRWHQAGIGMIHVEMGGYETDAQRDTTLLTLTGLIDSLAMSLSEFNALCPDCNDLRHGMRQLGERMGLQRVCIHADEWAISATRLDPAQEREALMMGCLLASARAASGRPVFPDRLPAEATFSPPPYEDMADRDGWNFVSCSVPYLACPVSTLGLGDTFMAGCLLVLGQEKQGQGAPCGAFPHGPAGHVEPLAPPPSHPLKAWP